ncbi:alpha/beta hydrolase [Actinoplanes awajinensis]|uniref:Alpha/beta hydrolase n=1 Tax=Actinoplanes awajinensis subsp. mycoplanecinus TaxID=135947 RepID=A0A101JCC5_9ACTN|nr:alpha/beta hydrolase [Actinoplanes awajinensis]KUL24184.1 alpha/beta hydrolase [Actinoplanes awajinensis subsp. mycoplanecinus]
MLHPQVTAAARLRRRPTAEQLAASPYDQLLAARTAMEESNEAETGPALPLPVVADLDADGVPCRLYATRADAPLFVYLHGGGWCYGSIETVDRFCRRVADRSGCAVLSVGYRLAPEHVHPAALDDAATVLGYVRKNGSELGVDPSRLAIGGDSAGGQLATVTARRQRDAATPLDFQALIYPALDPLTSAESYDELGEYGLDRASMKLAWETYVPDPRQRLTPDVAPLAVADLSGMPPTLIITAEYDALRDEGADYADALISAGVPVVHTRYMGVNHGFARKIATIDAARAAADQVAAVLRAALTF